MFEAFFAFSTPPFGRGLSTNNLLPHAAFAEALSRLEYAATRRQFMLFTGEVGSGKSTALRALIAALPNTRYTALYVSDSQLTPRNFYWEILHQLGQQPRFYRGDARRQLHAALHTLAEGQKQPVILIDEGHLLDKAMLEEIRFLLNFEVDSYAPMALIVAGQPELRLKLKLQVFEAISQRVNIRYHLPALTLEETAQYIGHHLARAGATGQLFTEPAMRLVHESSGGIPRRINNICTACLLYALTQQRRLIDDEMTRQVLDNEFSN